MNGEGHGEAPPPSRSNITKSIKRLLLRDRRRISEKGLRGALMWGRQKDNLSQSTVRNMKRQLILFQKMLRRVELDLRNSRETMAINTETGLVILLLMKDIDSLRSEVRWMVGIMITVFVSLMALIVTIILALLV